MLQPSPIFSFSKLGKYEITENMFENMYILRFIIHKIIIWNIFNFMKNFNFINKTADLVPLSPMVLDFDICFFAFLEMA